MSGFTSFKTMPHKVLVVEDEVLTRTSLSQILDSHFQEVHYTEDGHLGLEMFYRVQPDIIFTDIVMPTMNGMEMLRQIKNSKDINPLIVVFSAFDTAVDDQELEELGVFKIIKKPFNMKMLETFLDELKQFDTKNQ